jgi:hypothetical protein
MKHPYLDLGRYNAQLFAGRDGLTLRTASGKTYGVLRHAPDPQAFEHDVALKVPKPSWAVQHALNVLAALDVAITKVERDPKLSPEGRRDYLAIEGRDPAIKTLAAVAEELGKFQADTRNAEIHHYRVPVLDRQDILGYLQEQEIRGHIRSLGDRAKAEMIRPLMEAKDPLLSLAILRSPLPIDSLHADAEKGWHTYRDSQDPDTASRITLAKNSAEWADTIIKVAAGHVKRELTAARPTILATDEEVLANVVPPGAHALFGLRAPRALH